MTRRERLSREKHERQNDSIGRQKAQIAMGSACIARSRDRERERDRLYIYEARPGISGSVQLYFSLGACIGSSVDFESLVSRVSRVSRGVRQLNLEYFLNFSDSASNDLARARAHLSSAFGSFFSLSLCDFLSSAK